MKTALLAAVTTIALGCGSPNGPSGSDALPTGTAASLSIAPGSSTMTSLYDTLQLTATARDAQGRAIRATPTWSSSDRSSASVDVVGSVVAYSNGTVTITARMDTATATATVQVQQKPAKLVITGQPGDLTIGSRMSPIVTLEIRDARGFTMRNPAGDVTLTLRSPQSGASLSGVTTATFQSGYAGFANLSVRPVGGGNRLIATASGLTDSSTAFEVIGFGTVAAGGDHTCAITLTHKTVCWGENNSGELGDGTLNRHPVPEFISGSQDLASLTLGGSHSCGLSATNLPVCWGSNYAGQLGDNSTAQRLVPTAVVGGFSFASLIASASHTCGLTSAGAAYCWGRGEQFGALGDGFMENRSTPTAVVGGLTFTALAAGGSTTCGLTPAEAVYCWGFMGNYTFAITPTVIPGSMTFRRIAKGWNHACGITAQDDAYCWGENIGGKLGDGTNIDRASPVPVAGGLKFSSIAAGYWHTCGLTTAGAAYCWGQSTAGTIGNPAYQYGSFTPVPVAGNVTFVQLSAGDGHNCGRTAEGALLCWGSNSVGQLGIGGGVNQSSPVVVIWKK